MAETTANERRDIEQIFEELDDHPIRAELQRAIDETNRAIRNAFRGRTKKEPTDG